MPGKSFTERFGSRNASPHHAANTKQQKPTTPGRRRAKRLIGAPLEFVSEVCRLTEGRATLVVALYTYRRVQICDNRTVTLPSGELAELGIVPQYKQSMHPVSTPGQEGAILAEDRLGSHGGLGLQVRLPIPGQQVGDFVGGVIWKPGQHVSKPSLRIDVVHLAGFDQGVDGGGTMTTSI